MNRYSNFINIYNEAKDFKYVAFNIIKTGENRFADKILGTQFAVNGLFSMELYLKSIYCLENSGFIHGHELDKLYEKLSDKTKAYLTIQKDNIGEYFKKYSKGFEEWRYSFEKDSLNISIQETKEVLIILDEFCESIYKELKVNE